jgi:diguanylate cyclase (GGDEF)-like protein
MIERPAPPDRELYESMPAVNSAVDPITGFLNRNAGLQAVARAVAEANSKRSLLAVLWVDMDRFRQVNDSFGHAGGDSVIVRIAERIRSCVSTPGQFLRMGSDEFVVLIPGLDRIGAEQLAGRLLLEIEMPMPIDDILIRPSASIGIALGHVDDYPLGLLERADRAMIEAKRQGGNRIVISGNEPVAGRLGVQLAREELAIESALHAALESGGLQLEFQPIIRHDGSVEAVEALMRCNARGLKIRPGKFIPVAEKTGLIFRLGEWSLLQGARCAALLREQGRSTKVAINVSRVQLTSPSFMQALHGALICANVAPELIELELTESLFMDLSATVQANVRGARSAGVGLAIDDFGTGYSCLSSLKDLPATKLKLDRSFISVLPRDRRAFAIVRAMTQLARDLGMIVVAEGVETREQLDACATAGVDATQGFFNACPMSEGTLLQWMKSGKQK